MVRSSFGRSNHLEIELSIYVEVRAVPSFVDDEHMIGFTDQLAAIYESPDKSPSRWTYLSNRVLGFNQFIP